ncbi:alpha/beta hydrolase [Mycobacterium terramassiliense]|jgi:S-formylglutathione hydrolase FrmB|uniref:Membrane protein n=1 Tax=Mycobacterium terramassiliense TaxID=1841859 RepID=A0A2U3NGX7_9MYCO|nr:alpha/beta hydrolase-fold protein [Mycobacterium terramassiliense]SPM30772.1 membrane protein [Mycobacterium terramassiliense]
MQLTVSNHISLIHGWVPLTVEVLTAVALALAIGWRSRRWRLLWLPLAAVVGGVTAGGAHWSIAGLNTEPAPRELYVWIALVGLATAVLILGWRGARWWRRGLSILAVPLCLLCSLLVLNQWVGYFQTVQSAWDQLTSRPLPNQTDKATAVSMAAKGTKPVRGSLVPVQIPSDASQFRHREELVYLPPAWFASYPPPQLPTVMMIGGMLSSPADWVRAGNAVETVDAFAAAHGGSAPVLVFVDAGGAFDNDTECVNGSRGNAADHLTKDVVPYVVSNFGVSPDPSHWGVVGWSMGGTCAVDLTVMHPTLFSAFVDIEGDLTPNTGTKAQTIASLFGGNAEAWAAFDPTTVINRHGRYTGVSGWFAISSGGSPTPSREVTSVDSAAMALAGRGAAADPGNQAAAAGSLCALGRANGIDCAVVAHPGKHDWPTAGTVFSTALPWLAGRLGTPDVPRIPLPGTESAPSHQPHTEAVAHGQR